MTVWNSDSNTDTGFASGEDLPPAADGSSQPGGPAVPAPAGAAAPDPAGAAAPAPDAGNTNPEYSQDSPLQSGQTDIVIFS